MNIISLSRPVKHTAKQNKANTGENGNICPEKLLKTMKGNLKPAT